MLLSEFLYELPDEKVARYPVSPRDTSKLLIYKAGQIQHSQFKQLSEQLPASSYVVFNDTKVIPARALMRKATGALIEILLLNPELPTRIVNDAMLVTNSCTWKCMIGNKKKWKALDVLQTTLRIGDETVLLEARLVDTDQNWVEFQWNREEVTFLDIVKSLGEIPLPPYLGREAELADVTQYQTVYAAHDGAVAAPTAGLHFTDAVLSDLAEKGIRTGHVTLHVGAGTFQPVKAEMVREHAMHQEQVVYTRELVTGLLANLEQVIAVGTTSMRSLESLYWFGVGIINDPNFQWYINQEYAYQDFEVIPTAVDALKAVLGKMDALGKDVLTGETAIYIYPGYEFRIVKGLVTNYHQPGSTLIMLVAAFIGDDWKNVYQQALDNDYRFLSFGDSSLLWRKEN